MSTDFRYCQADIEGTIRCEQQCDHCKQYYGPLEEEYDYFDEEDRLVRTHFNLEEFMAFSALHKCEVIRGADYMFELHIDNKGAYSNSLTFMGAIVEGLKAFKNISK